MAKLLPITSPCPDQASVVVLTQHALIIHQLAGREGARDLPAQGGDGSILEP